jgi:branched-chain amino acid transport system ATP-binding protein
VHVMSNGAVIASGTPDEVRRNPDVIDAYLGRRGEPPAAGAEPGEADA